jgi:deoxyadenosine/deoxycytidine kinase
LLVLLDAPADELLARVAHRGRACERRLTEAQLERIRRTVGEQAKKPGLGPVLHVAGVAEEGIVAQVLAAVRGME